jgi:hypothetical protein
MDNHILHIQVLNRALDPVEAELWVHVAPQRLTPITEVRGRLMGPRCRYSSTVEIAYPLRPFSRPPQLPAGLSPSLTMRVVIPEPSLWDPESPFLYEGPVELWQDGRPCDRIEVRHGLRRALLGPQGLRWNGAALTLRGRRSGAATEDEVRAWRDQGVNLLVVPVSDDTRQLWDVADRIGMLLLGRVSSPDEAVLAGVRRLSGHPSALGWLIEGPALHCRESAPQLADVARGILGARLDEPPGQALLPAVRFIACPVERAEEFAGLGLPLLLIGGAPAAVPLLLGRVV